MNAVLANLCTDLYCHNMQEGAGLGLRKSTVFYMDLPALYYGACTSAVDTAFLGYKIRSQAFKLI